MRYCQNKHRLNEELGHNLRAMQELASDLKKNELRLSIESKKRLREDSQDGKTLRKYKKILKYIQTTTQQQRNTMEERMRAIDIQDALQDILMDDN